MIHGAKSGAREEGREEGLPPWKCFHRPEEKSESKAIASKGSFLYLR